MIGGVHKLKVVITGWYGTETMGDRAILDGILSVLHALDGENLSVKIGSLFPFYTERTIFEEREIFSRSAPGVSIEIFSVKDRRELEDNVVSSDIVIMGGGPLMDLEELYIVRRCFACAKKRGIPAVVMGCGVGPLNNQRYREIVREIFSLSLGISFRDNISVKTAEIFCGNAFDFRCLGDPAVISVMNYMKDFPGAPGLMEYCAVNFRGNPGGQYGRNVATSDDNLRELVMCLSETFGAVRLVPMHTFFVGGDDRYYLAEIAQGIKSGVKCEVIHSPQNLHGLYECFKNARACVGMRYHSVVMQTILNGNNAILDYTDPYSGKIAGFVNDLEGADSIQAG